LSRRLIAEHADLALSISATTRPPRRGESDGREYRFVGADRFKEMIGGGELLEWAEVHEHHYGTPRRPIVEALAEGRDVLFDIDWQGARAIHAAQPDDTVRVFVLPPSMADLAERLRSRAQDADDVISRRLGRAKGEIGMWAEYDYVILNDDFDRAYAELDVVYRAERLRRVRNPWIVGFIQGLMDEAI
jgi:guanylate kinase